MFNLLLACRSILCQLYDDKQRSIDPQLLTTGKTGSPVLKLTKFTGLAYIDSDHLLFLPSQLFNPRRFIPRKSILSSISITIQACENDLYVRLVVNVNKQKSAYVIAKNRLRLIEFALCRIWFVRFPNFIVLFLLRWKHLGQSHRINVQSIRTSRLQTIMNKTYSKYSGDLKTRQVRLSDG